MIQTQITRVTFGKNIGFRKELNKRVDAYFKSNNITTRDNAAMYFKSTVILGWVIFCWIFILFSPPVIGLKILGCIMLGIGFACVGFSIGHDANHGGYSSKKWVNTAFGFTYDLILGLSSHLWKIRHNFLHHTYTNILGHDVDIYGDGLVRMSPFIERKWFHKFQHLFIYFGYTMLLFFWFVGDVYFVLFNRKYHEYVIPKPKTLDMVILLGSKLIFLGIYIGIPIAVGYSPIQSILGFCIAYMTAGFLSGNLFMLAHVVQAAEFIQPNPESKQIDDEWAVFQVKTTVDFAPKNRFLSWYIGGLNYQTVHHLLPHICHIHYPKIASILAQVCEEYGIKYNVYPTFGEALAANYSWLKLMGNSPKISPVTPQAL